MGHALDGVSFEMHWVEPIEYRGQMETVDVWVQYAADIGWGLTVSTLSDGTEIQDDLGSYQVQALESKAATLAWTRGQDPKRMPTFGSATNGVP